MAGITPKEFAAKVGSDGRTVRKFLRSKQGLDMRVGKGHRWEIDSKQVKSLTTKFRKWDEARQAPPAAETAEDA